MAKTVAQAIAALTARFAAVDSNSARLDARVLTAHALGRDPDQLFGRAEIPLPPGAEAALEGFAARRLAFEPVSRIIGRREFWSMDFALTRDTLDPRADTETLVAAVLAVRDAYTAPRLLDLGAGTGCILLAILKDWPTATGIGVDLNPGAVTVAADNAQRLGLAARAAFRVGNWCAGLGEKFDLIVSNPPYVADNDLESLAPAVTRFDPRLALSGGADGLAAYSALLPEARRHLQENGRIFLEIGAGQAEAVSGLLALSGFRATGEHRDLAGFVRCLEAVPA